MGLLKPMLACDWNPKLLRFPLLAQPKADGVRGLTQESRLYARSLKPISSKFLQEQFSRPELMGLDGELCTGSPTDPNLMQQTSSMVGSFDKTEPTTLWVFDLIDPETSRLAYKHRLFRMSMRVLELKERGFPVDLVPSRTVYDLDQLTQLEDEWLDAGYEGVILRDPGLPYKHGRSTAREGALLRIKRFTDTEGEVIELIRGTTNTNEAQTNELGRTFRSTSKDGKVPVDRIGAFNVRNLETGRIDRVSTGKFTIKETEDMFKNPDRYMGRILKYKFFGHGMLIKPRFPGALGWRDPIDIS